MPSTRRAGHLHHPGHANRHMTSLGDARVCEEAGPHNRIRHGGQLRRLRFGDISMPRRLEPRGGRRPGWRSSGSIAVTIALAARAPANAAIGSPRKQRRRHGGGWRAVRAPVAAGCRGAAGLTAALSAQRYLRRSAILQLMREPRFRRTVRPLAGLGHANPDRTVALAGGVLSARCTSPIQSNEVRERGAKRTVRTGDPEQRFRIRPAMEASGGEQPSLLLLVRSRSLRHGCRW